LRGDARSPDKLRAAVYSSVTAHPDRILIMPEAAYADQTRPNLAIEAAYRERTPGSARLAEQARGLFPSGVTHDGRHLEPYGIYVERAQGPDKWDVDGNRYIDYYGGHGALLLGHNHPAVAAAVQQALANGTHFGASHPLEVRWAEAIRRLMPAAERVRFTSSGTEATLMAVRLARASRNFSSCFSRNSGEDGAA
jgi:glutamate-1-semialdehyde 2,1-aminomutase